VIFAHLFVRKSKNKFVGKQNLAISLRVINQKNEKMKKLFLSLALASAVAFANAQDMTSKKGVPILPESGDWSISFDAKPIINYFGNLANGDSDNSTTINWADPNGMTIVGKMIRDNDVALRGKLRIGINSRTTESIVPTADPNAPANTMVTNEMKVSSMNIGLAGGIQKYRGKGRLKGYYGAELGFSIGSGSDTTFTYGDPLDSNWNAGPRVTEIDAGGTFGVSLRGFIGVEFFFAPKMSVGAEYGWGLALNSQGEGETSMEGLPTSPAAVKTGKTSSFSLDTDIAGGAIWLSFYF
jgi:hypothetical protein